MKRKRIITYLICCTVLIVVLVGIFLIVPVTGPAKRIGSLTIPRDSSKETLTLWHASPLLSLPMINDSPVAYVEYRGSWKRIHGPSFEYGVGRVLIAPDHSHAAVEARFKGANYVRVLIDLVSGQMTLVDEFSDPAPYSNWEERHWEILNKEPV